MAAWKAMRLTGFEIGPTPDGHGPGQATGTSLSCERSLKKVKNRTHTDCSSLDVGRSAESVEVAGDVGRRRRNC